MTVEIGRTSFKTVDKLPLKKVHGSLLEVAIQLLLKRCALCCMQWAYYVRPLIDLA